MKNFSGLILCISIAFLFSCNSNSESSELKKEDVLVTKVDSTTNLKADTTALVIPDEKLEAEISLDSNLTRLTKEILLVLKNKDYADLVNYIHPEVGTLFSPYGFIDNENSMLLTRKMFTTSLNDGKKLLWGSYDGSGDPISLSLKDYLEKFVYNKDYLNAEKFSVNKFLGSGNSLNNLKKVFPGLNFTESYFSGFKKELSGMDWTTLRLVFLKAGDKYYLRGVVHDQWTI